LFAFLRSLNDIGALELAKFPPRDQPTAFGAATALVFALAAIGSLFVLYWLGMAAATVLPCLAVAVACVVGAGHQVAACLAAPGGKARQRA